jgi:hypothetical protein
MRMRMLMTLVLLLACWSLCSDAAPDRESIRKAIDRGAKYLKDPAVAQNYLTQQRVGYVAVVGLALLESDIPPSDPVLEKITAMVRDQCLKRTETYDLALCLVYLDRLGEPQDVPIIQYLGLRLMAGQTSAGIWTYTWGPAVTNDEAEALRKLLQGGTELKGRESTKKGPEGGPAKKEAPKKIVPVTIDPNTKEEEKPADTTPKLHPEVKKIMDRVEMDRRAKQLLGPNNGLGIADAEMGGGDLSNTQFAIIGLWCSRKYGVPAEAILLRAEDYFRKTQNPDGGWAYTRGSGASTAAMTCPGLISLAMGVGLKKPPKGKEKEFDPNDDPWMRRGLVRLGQFMAGQGNGQFGQPNVVGVGGENLNLNYYFLWSLERTGVIYGIETMNNVEWFSWGTEILLKSQGQNGSWSGGAYHGATGDLDTAFALLFLNRANLAKDLTANLKGRIRDPGATTIRGGKDLQALMGKNAPTGAAPAAEKGTGDRPNDPQPTPTAVSADPYEKQVRELSDTLVRATAADRKDVLTKLRDSKGAVYTDALGRAARLLEGQPLKETRDALSSRLSRMTANTLKELLRDPNREIRRAAAIACAIKEDKTRVPDLIDGLSDTDPVVSRAAHASLKSLTGKDFGPEPDAPPADVAKAAAAWKAWWVTQK